MTKSHEGKVAILTGGAGGLGRYFARALANAGADVAIADLQDGSAAVADIEATGQRGYSEVCDLSDGQQVTAFAERVIDKFGKVDILINNAAYMPLTPYEDFTVEKLRMFMAVNVEASLLLARAVVPGMKERQYGRIVQIASSTIGTPMPKFGPYVTSKMAGVGLVRALAAELANDGILVNALAPGLTATEESRNHIPQAQFDAVADLQLINETEEPQDLCGAMLFLTSEQCGFVIGQTINCDGGVNF